MEKKKKKYERKWVHHNWRDSELQSLKVTQGVKKETHERKIEIMIPGDSPYFLKPLFFILNTEGKFVSFHLSVYLYNADG